MAREVNYRCDICRKQTSEIVAKLFFGPTGKKKETRSAAIHSRYTHHLDVGVCCSEKLLRVFNWHPRQTAAEYAARRTKKHVPPKGT